MTEEHYSCELKDCLAAGTAAEMPHHHYQADGRYWTHLGRPDQCEMPTRLACLRQHGLTEPSEGDLEGDLPNPPKLGLPPTSEPTGSFAASGVDDELTQVQKDNLAKVSEILDWWMATAKTDAERTAPKTVEYGAVDFDIMGQFMVALIHDKFEGADNDELMRVGRELAVAFYLIGKLGRMAGAYQQGVLPSDDTIFDATIYTMMLRRIRETGQWP